MKTTKCRYCGKQVPVQPNERVKPHVVGKQRCIGAEQSGREETYYPVVWIEKKGV